MTVNAVPIRSAAPTTQNRIRCGDHRVRTPSQRRGGRRRWPYIGVVSFVMEALRAMEAGDDPAAIERLVAGWPKLRDPDVARVIERLDTRMTARMAGIGKLAAGAA